MDTMTAQQAIEKLENYRKAAAFTASEMDIPEELYSKVYDIELHNACISALCKQTPKEPRISNFCENCGQALNTEITGG